MSKNFGEDRSNAYLSLKVPPPSIIALREELTHHQDIYDYAIQGTSFEDCMAKIAEKLDILLEGMYDAEKLAEVLVEALRNRRFHGNQPHLRSKHLVNVELVERKGTMTIEKVEGDIGTIAGTASVPKELAMTFTPIHQRNLEGEFISHYTEHEGGTWYLYPHEYNVKRKKAVPHQQLLTEIRRRNKTLTTLVIGGVRLHSFLTTKGRSWDTINGWRLTQQVPAIQNSAAGLGNQEAELRPSLSESADSEQTSGSDTTDSQQKH